MTAPDRIPCLNPRCRRTAPAENYRPGTQIVCGKCWRTLPQAWRREYVALRRRSRRMQRLIDRRVAAGNIHAEAIDRLWYLFAHRWNALWHRIRNHFGAPTFDLESFLRELGL